MDSSFLSNFMRAQADKDSTRLIGIRLRGKTENFEFEARDRSSWDDIAK